MSARALRARRAVRPLAECTVVVTPRSFGMHDPGLREELERTVGAVHYHPGPLASGELAKLVTDADGLLAGVDEIDAAVFEHAPRLRVIARYGVGVDRVDLDAAAQHGVIVTVTPGANANAVAELTVALLFAVARPIVRGNEAARAGDWHALAGIELAGRTLGLVGLGRIGRLVAEKARALGMSVLATDPYVDFHADAQLVDLETLCAEADVVSLHAPLTDETRGLVDGPFLERLKPGAALVNTARAGLVNEDALLVALESGHLRAAALDVLEQEPPPAGHPLLARDEVLVTPHMGPHTAESTTAMGRVALDELVAVLSGRMPRFRV
jgi:D-3-phosphoglycerate dehydrogenase / 2-oxoglutarate reductase